MEDEQENVLKCLPLYYTLISVYTWSRYDRASSTFNLWNWEELDAPLMAAAAPTTA